MVELRSPQSPIAQNPATGKSEPAEATPKGNPHAHRRKPAGPLRLAVADSRVRWAQDTVQSGLAHVAAEGFDDAAPMSAMTNDSRSTARMCLQARLPNDVVLDLRDCDLRQAGVAIEALWRVRCSGSTKR